MSDFIHLHVHTEYSLLDGAIRLNSLIKKAKEFNMDSVAITDHGTMFGTIEFYEKAKKAGIKPIIGCECYVAPRTINDRTPEDKKGLRHLVLIAKNNTGYKNLCKLATIGQLEGSYYKPRIDKDLLEKYHEGLIALSACLHGEIPYLIIEGRDKEAQEKALWYKELFGDNFYLEIQHNNIDEQEKVNQALLDIHKKFSIPLVATNDCHYLQKDDVFAHEVLLCIQTGKTLQDTNRFKFNTDQLYFKSPDEMIKNFGSWPGAIENTLAIASQCEIEFDMNTYHFPVFDTKDKTSNELLDEMAWQGFEKIIKRNKDQNITIEDYKKRLEKELNVIKDMGFPGYFLIVSDFIKYAKANGVPVGPGRGSAAGSLVAYCLEITDLDPLKHQLIFERFLNPARKSMPDIDVDFCIEGREKIYKYVVEKYGGSEYVSQIITFGKMKSRAVIRDVGRALGIPLGEVDAIAKMIPEVININLHDALEQEPRIRELANEKKEINDLINISLKLEGLPRHSSTHAAGVVIGDKKLVNYLPLHKGKNNEVVTQFDMKCVEKIGLVKFDFLGLRNLTVINQALKFIKNQGIEPPDINNLDMNDQKTFKLLQSGDTTGVFQLESSGMKELMVRLKPECFDDVTALVALYRPGPLDSGMVDDFVKRKHGQIPVKYILPELEPILKDTYGVIVYQEQVMMIASALADYTMSEADDLRKAMGKKIVEILSKHRERFMTGAEKKGLDLKKAGHIFDLMEKFGGYGFNKSHSAAYALIAYQTAWLKAHYPVEFMASLLTSEMNNSDAVVKFINECKTHKISVLPPDINKSDKKFKAKNSEIIFGLVAIKNVGEGAINSIIKARKKKPFKSLFDFCERVDLRKVNKRVIESLIKCGAFSSIKANRSQLIEALDMAIDFGQKSQKQKNSSQMDLFGNQEIKLNYPTLPDLKEWDESIILAYEKEILGFYVSGHPLEKYNNILQKFCNVNTSTVSEKSDGFVLRIAGQVTQSKTIKTKKGDSMAFVTIEDLYGSIEIVVFSDVYLKCFNYLIEDNPVIVEGKLQKDENSAKIISSEILPLDQAEEKLTASVQVNIDVDYINDDTLEKLKEIIDKNKGNCLCFFNVKIPEKGNVLIALPNTKTINYDEKLKNELIAIPGIHAVETRCKPAKVNENNGRRKNYRYQK